MPNDHHQSSLGTQIEAETNLINLHVTGLKVSLGGYAELLLDLRLVKVGLDPTHLFVTERSVGFLVSIAFLSNVVGVSTRALDRSGDSPAGEGSGDAAESIRAVIWRVSRISRTRSGED